MSDALPPLIPRQVLFGNPTFAIPQISPDGRRLAYLAPDDGVLNVWLRELGEDEGRPVTKDRDRGVRFYAWAQSSEHLLYLQDREGDENFRLHLTDLASGDTRDLTPFEDVQVNWLQTSRDVPDEVLFTMNRDDPQLHDLWRLDLRTGETAVAARNPGNVMQWVAHRNLRRLAGLGATPDGGFDLLLFDERESSWRPLLHWGAEDAMPSAPVAFTRDGGGLYVMDSREANAARLVLLDCGTGATSVLAADARYDVTEVVVDPEAGHPQLVCFQRAKPEWEVLDPAISADWEAASALDRGVAMFSGRDREDRRWVLSFLRDDGPVAYWVYDRASGDGTFLFENRPELRRWTLAPMEPVTFDARDGLRLEGYLTLPPGVEARNLPAVVNVHGGPWHRDTWQFHPEAQWLANRGYACLQVNFRGSTGYGKDFVNAADREWGGKMHDDVVDAVRWLIERGIADPGRVGIYGGSYGGYAALCGATFTPELFRCAVDVVGPSNLISWIESVPPYWAPLIAVLRQRVGDPEKEAEFLRSRSPLFHIDRIRSPLLIVHGANDPRVKQAESEQIVAALRDKGIDHEYLLFPDEGHGFAKPENRLRFYAAAEAFLARHLGGRAEE